MQSCRTSGLISSLFPRSRKQVGLALQFQLKTSLLAFLIPLTESTFLLFLICPFCGVYPRSLARKRIVFPKWGSIIIDPLIHRWTLCAVGRQLCGSCEADIFCLWLICNCRPTTAQNNTNQIRSQYLVVKAARTSKSSMQCAAQHLHGINYQSWTQNVRSPNQKLRNHPYRLFCSDTRLNNR